MIDRTARILPFTAPATPTRRGPRTNPPGVVVPMPRPMPLRLDESATLSIEDKAAAEALADSFLELRTFPTDMLLMMPKMLRGMGNSFRRDAGM
jgi:hypothetical protein